MNVDELLAESVGTRPASNSRCWARKLEGTAREYLNALEDQPVEDVYQVRVVEILNGLGYSVSDGQVSDHLRQVCKCRK